MSLSVSEKEHEKSLVDNLPDWPELEEKLAKGLSPKQGIEFTVTLDPKKSSMRQVILRKVKELVNDRYTVGCLTRESKSNINSDPKRRQG